MATTKVTSNLLAPSAAQTNINSGASLTLSVPTQVNNTLTTNNKVVIDSANAIANPKMLIMSTTASGAADNAPLVIKGSGVNILASINLRTTGGSGELYSGWVTGNIGGGIQVNNSFTVSNGSTGPTTGTTMFSVTTTSVGVGIATPNAAAILDVTSTTKGFLPPRMTTTQRNAITSVPAGLVIYNTTTSNLNTYNGSAWVELVDSADLGTGIPTFLADPSSENLANALGDTIGTGPFILQDAATLTGPNLEQPIITGPVDITDQDSSTANRVMTRGLVDSRTIISKLDTNFTVNNNASYNATSMVLSLTAGWWEINGEFRIDSAVGAAGAKLYLAFTGSLPEAYSHRLWIASVSSGATNPSLLYPAPLYGSGTQPFLLSQAIASTAAGTFKVGPSLVYLTGDATITVGMSQNAANVSNTTMLAFPFSRIWATRLQH